MLFASDPEFVKALTWSFGFHAIRVCSSGSPGHWDEMSNAARFYHWQMRSGQNHTAAV